jgi:hypothetical protein
MKATINYIPTEFKPTIMWFNALNKGKVDIYDWDCQHIDYEVSKENFGYYDQDDWHDVAVCTQCGATCLMIDDGEGNPTPDEDWVL